MMICLLPKIFAIFIKINSLSTAVYDLWPKYLTPEKAWNHAITAWLVSTDDWPAERLLAIARVESHLEPSDTSWRDGNTGKRLTAKWLSNKRGASFVSPYFCGPLQTKALTWADCIAQRDLTVGYSTAVRELKNWKRLCQQKKYRIHDYRCALAGHGGGGDAARRVAREAAHMNRAEWKGIKPKLKPPYWMRVLAREKTLRDHLASIEEVI